MNDGLCLVVDAPVAEQRLNLLDSLNIGLLIKDDTSIRAVGKAASSIGLT
jgi:hypothetical protein